MFSKMNEALLSVIVRFQRQDGQALAEYGLLLDLIAVVCILALNALGLAMAGSVSKITGSIESRIRVSPAARGVFATGCPFFTGSPRKSSCLLKLMCSR